MKKITAVSVASFLFLILCSAFEYILRDTITDQLLALILGIAILIVSGILAIFAGDAVWLNAICFSLSAVSMGILLRAWYINRGFDNSFGIMLLVSLAAVAYLWIFFALSRIPIFRESRNAYVAFATIYAIVSGVAYLIVMLNTKTTFVSTFGYYMIIELAFIFAMSLEVENPRQLFRNLTLSTYSVFIVAIGVAVAMLIALVCGDGADCDCDCDCVDACECADCGCDVSGNTPKKKKK